MRPYCPALNALVLALLAPPLAIANALNLRFWPRAYNFYPYQGTFRARPSLSADLATALRAIVTVVTGCATTA